MEATNAYIIVSKACNMTCRYCFERDVKGCETISDDAIDRGVKLIVEGAQARGGGFCISAFGGEPLMFPDKVERIILQSINHAHINHTPGFVDIHTNGTLWNKRIEKLLSITDQYVKLRVLIGIDGDRETYEKFKSYISGRSSYNKVIANIPKYMDAIGDPSRVYSQTALVRSNLPTLHHTYRTLKDLGFRQLHFVKTKVLEASEHPDIREEAIWSPEDLAIYETQLNLIADDILQSNEPLLEANCVTIFSRCLFAKPNAPCKCGTDLICIAPDGDIYPCHGFYAMQQYKMGDVWQGYVTPNIFPNITWASFGCGDCDAYYCFICPAHNYFIKGDMCTKAYDYVCEVSHIEARVFNRIAKRG